MANIADQYTYQVRWSQRDQQFVATVAEMPSLSWVGTTPIDCFISIRTLAIRCVCDMLAEGEQVPMPLDDRELESRSRR